MPKRNTGIAADSRIELRIGINLGDAIVEGDRALALNPSFARGWYISGGHPVLDEPARGSDRAC
jgi:hypothetical protein